MDREGRLPEKLLEYLYSECAIGAERIATLLDSNPSTVYTMLKKYGIKRRKTSGIHIDKVHAVITLTEAGWGTTSIRRATNLAPRTISIIRQDHRDGNEIREL